MIPSVGAGTGPDGEARAFLVLEESEPVRNQLRDILAKLGVPTQDIRYAATAQEALERFEQRAPDLVFAELVGVHPEDGLEVVHEMLERAPQTRIVLVTAESRDSAEVRAAVRAGVFAVIEKPLRAEKVRHVLQELEGEESAIERLR